MNELNIPNKRKSRGSPEMLAVSKSIHSRIKRLCENEDWYMRDFVEAVLSAALDKEEAQGD